MNENKNSNEILLNNRVFNKCYLEYLNVLEEEKISLDEFKQFPKDQRLLDIEEVIEHNENIESLIYDFKRLFKQFNN